MKNWDEQAEKIMIERFGKDTVIAHDRAVWQGYGNCSGNDRR